MGFGWVIGELGGLVLWFGLGLIWFWVGFVWCLIIGYFGYVLPFDLLALRFVWLIVWCLGGVVFSCYDGFACFLFYCFWFCCVALALRFVVFDMAVYFCVKCLIITLVHMGLLGLMVFAVWFWIWALIGFGFSWFRLILFGWFWWLRGFILDFLDFGIVWLLVIWVWLCLSLGFVVVYCCVLFVFGYYFIVWLYLLCFRVGCCSGFSLWFYC